MEHVWCAHCNVKIKNPRTIKGVLKKFCTPNCRKRNWDKHNQWKYKDVCPSCGGLKSKVAKYCQHCKKQNNPEGINQYSVRR